MMSLVIGEVFGDWELADKSMLHIAPEDCLRPMLAEFGLYETADLEMRNVDYQADLQQLPFADQSYDSILVSRVLTIPPDLNACLDELRRVLKPGGIAIVAETFMHDENVEYGRMQNGRSRKIGIRLLSQLEERFDRVDRYFSDRYPAEFQLNNRMTQQGVAIDDYPACVRIPKIGFMDLVAVCHKSRDF
jgi:SAM-dependent methyltransferase